MAQLPNPSPDWRTWPFVRVQLRHLPQSATTLEIYSNLYRYGNIARINILEGREDHRSVRAEVTFAPPPLADLLNRYIPFKFNSNSVHNVRVELSQDQRKNFVVQSPTQATVVYQEQTKLLGSALEFGVLQSAKSMMVMTKRDAEQNEELKLVLNLRQREIHVHFPSRFTSSRSSAIREFRFFVAIDEDFKVWRRRRDQSLIIHLKNPPWYSKKLKERIAESHSKDARFWNEDDAWARQTDIYGIKEAQAGLQNLPISLRKMKKKEDGINISRWTTFRFIPKTSPEGDDKELKVFRDALRDFNVHIVDVDDDDFEILNAPHNIEQQTWELINSEDVSKVGTIFDLDFSRVVLPFPVRYQLEVCLSHGWISEYSISREFFRKLLEWPEHKARQALVYVDSFRERLFDPMQLFSDIRYVKPVLPKQLPDGCIEIRSAVITATGVIFNTPSVEIANRVVRKHERYADRFLRVRFQDDDYRGKTRLYPGTNNKMVNIYQRVQRALISGIIVDDVQYDFLAWGNSQLREHGVYFFANKGDVTADSIREKLGIFEEKVVAKRAARMGQCFSTTRQIKTTVPQIKRSEASKDIIRGPYTYTDGVGKISRKIADFISEELKIQDGTPSAFQFRMGGCKGVLVVDPTLHHTPGVEIRESQFKFESDAKHLEIIRYSEFWQPFLNRQIIICLSNLGVPNEVFLHKQSETIESLNAAMQDVESAKRALRDTVDPNQMTLSICELVEAGFMKLRDPFVTALLRLWRAWSLQYLKDKAKIPVKDGAFVLGCVDETSTLSGHFNTHQAGRAANDPRPAPDTLPQIFIQVKDPKTKQKKIIEGICIVARNPSLHKGDIRVVQAVDKPSLRHLVDVVVFPQTGDRDIPSMCSGGDLDGDDYIVIWDKELIPAVWNVEPFHYQAPKSKVAEESITTRDIVDFFVDYLRNDQLGRIAHAHLAAADSSDDGLDSTVCLQLLHLHSMAVDYPKTGVPAKMERHHERTQWPHFMEKKGKPYKSKKILGLLYDAVEKVKFEPDYSLPFDQRILSASRPSAQLLEKVQALKSDYDHAVSRILAQHDIRTEFELWSTFVLDHSKKAQDYKFHEEIGRLSKTLKDQYSDALTTIAGGPEFRYMAPVAIAAYQVTLWQVELALTEIKDGKRSADQMPYLSFPWLLQGTLCQIVNRYDETCIDGTTDDLHKSVASMTRGTQGEMTVEVPNEFELQLDQPIVSNLMADPYQPQVELQPVKSLSEEDLKPAQEALTYIDPSPAPLSPLIPPEDDACPEKAVLDETITLARSNIHVQTGQMSPEITDSESSGRRSCRGPINRTTNHATTPKKSVTCKYWKTNRQCYKSDSERAHAHHDTGTVVAHKSFTCYFWKVNGCCQNTDEQCSHAHYETGSVAHGPGGVLANVSPRPIAGSKQKNLKPPELTCFYWKQGHCQKSDSECSYAHYDTGMVAREPGSLPVTNCPAASPTTTHKSKTCFYWKQGHCQKPDSECSYAHYDTGKVARRPGQAIKLIRLRRSVERTEEEDEDEESHSPGIQNEGLDMQKDNPVVMAERDELQLKGTSPHSESNDTNGQILAPDDLALPRTTEHHSTDLTLTDPATLDDEQLKGMGLFIDELSD